MIIMCVLGIVAIGAFYLMYASLALPEYGFMAVLTTLILVFWAGMTKRDYLKKHISKSESNFVKLGASYRKYIMQNHKAAIVSILVLGLVFGGCLSSLLFAEETSARYSIRTVNRYNLVFADITLHPSFSSELWDLGSNPGVFRNVYLNDSASWVKYFVVQGNNHTVTNGIGYIDTTELSSGWHRIHVVSHSNVSFSFRIFVSKVNLELFQWEHYAGRMLALLFLTDILFIPLGFFLVMQPGRRYIDRIAVPEYRLGGVDEEKVGVLAKRTESLIEHLSGRTDYYFNKKTSLLSTVALMLGASTALPTAMFVLGVDIQIIQLELYFISWAVAFLVVAVYFLHKSTTDGFLPPTSWFHRKRISPDGGERAFRDDLSRNYHLLTNMSESRFVEDTIMEVVSLYYILRNAGNHCKAAQTAIATSLLTLLSGFAIMLIVPFGGLAGIGLILFLVLITTWYTFSVAKDWYDEEMSTTRLTLYHCTQKMDSSNSLNEGVEDMISDYFDIRLGVISTCLLTDDEMTELYTRLIDESGQRMAANRFTWFDFGAEGDPHAKFGTEIPVLVDEKYGKEEGIIVFPCTDQNGQTKRIIDFIKEHHK